MKLNPVFEMSDSREFTKGHFRFLELELDHSFNVRMLFNAVRTYNSLAQYESVDCQPWCIRGLFAPAHLEPTSASPKKLLIGIHPRTMAGKPGPPLRYYPPPIAQARGGANAVHQVCVRVELILPKCMRTQELSIIDAYLDLADVRENSILAL